LRSLVRRCKNGSSHPILVLFSAKEGREVDCSDFASIWPKLRIKNKNATYNARFIGRELLPAKSDALGTEAGEAARVEGEKKKKLYSYDRASHLWLFGHHISLGMIRKEAKASLTAYTTCYRSQGASGKAYRRPPCCRYYGQISS
jgi:hypothetical protein